MLFASSLCWSQELDANALVVRVAQLATEMKHRSKWEATRLLEALRVMEETAQKKVREEGTTYCRLSCA